MKKEIQMIQERFCCRCGKPAEVEYKEEGLIKTLERDYCLKCGLKKLKELGIN